MLDLPKKLSSAGSFPCFGGVALCRQVNASENVIEYRAALLNVKYCLYFVLGLCLTKNPRKAIPEGRNYRI